ncbi:glycoside hydrolase family 19 protein [Candidatus Pantoea formicae]|uniref:glycoside hydrolase family 19 protein n=1 Tax=Candidatus Pantoea formicae TaxID=2608355 RepID=UPI003EDB696D
MILFLPQFQRAAGLDAVTAQRWFQPFQAAINEFDISNTDRLAAFIAQTGHESQGFSRLTENLYYSDAERVARIFRSGFDINKNGVSDPAEIEFARAYTRNPEKLANRAYANRGGNGAEATGDGWKFRGRGLIQITLRDNYSKCGHALGLDLLKNPDLLLDFTNAARSAAWYFMANGCNQLADKGDFLTLTKRINSSAEGLADRQARLAKAKVALAA